MISLSFCYVFPPKSGMPGLPGIPGMPGMSGMAGMPSMPGMPGMPGQSAVYPIMSWLTYPYRPQKGAYRIL